MESKNKEEIIAIAEHALHYTNLLIEQCNSWLPENAGAKTSAGALRTATDKVKGKR
jgi:hypothetical protein